MFVTCCAFCFAFDFMGCWWFCIGLLFSVICLLFGGLIVGCC